MFDNLNQPKNNNQNIPNQTNAQKIPTPSKPAEVDDIFSATEPVNKPDALKPKSSSNLGVNTYGQNVDEGQRKKIMLLGGFLVVFLVVVFGGFYAINKILNKKNVDVQPIEPLVNNQNTTNDNQPVSDNTNQNINQPENNTEPVPVDDANKDSDQDGLVDVEEKTLGTDINNVDSDSDGLFDREEVKVYKTDPLNSDTDADGYKDGDEVKGGYNPAGTGKLFELPT